MSTDGGEREQKTRKRRIDPRLDARGWRLAQKGVTPLSRSYTAEEEPLKWKSVTSGAIEDPSSPRSDDNGAWPLACSETACLASQTLTFRTMDGRSTFSTSSQWNLIGARVLSSRTKDSVVSHGEQAVADH